MNWSRRRFLATGSAFWFLSDKSIAHETSANEGLDVFHTTDLHGHILPTESYKGEKGLGGLARCAHQIRQWRKASPNHLLLDIGDVYQGTLVSWQNRGRLMIDLFNKLGYDAWTLGNHEFDWGPEVVEEAILHSQMPVLAANFELDGKLVGAERSEGLFQKLRPWIIKEIAGEKVGVVGLITPGLPYWLREELLGPLKVVDPQPVLARCVKELKAEGATKIIVSGHMGWREHGDDFANPIGETLRHSGVALYLAGHSHRRNEQWVQEGVICTQASYYGLDCGRVRFVDGKAVPELVRMDAQVPLDAMILQASRKELDAAETESQRIVTQIKEPINGTAAIRELLAAAFAKVAEKQGAQVDAVFHGTFGTNEIAAGDFTVKDAWTLLPYENGLVYAELSAEELVVILQEAKMDRYSDRELLGLIPLKDESGKVTNFKCEDGSQRERYRVVMNSYDAQSGGRRLMKLTEILAQADSRSRLLPMDTREALLDYLANL